MATSKGKEAGQKHSDKQHNGFLSNTLLALERDDTHLGKQDAAKCFTTLPTSKGVNDLATQPDAIVKPSPDLQLHSHPDVFPTNNFKGVAGHALAQSGDGKTQQLDAECSSGTLDSGKVGGSVYLPKAASIGILFSRCFPSRPLGGSAAYVKHMPDIYVFLKGDFSWTS